MDYEVKKLVGVKFDEGDEGGVRQNVDGWIEDYEGLRVVVLTAVERISETSSSESTPLRSQKIHSPVMVCSYTVT